MLAVLFGASGVGKSSLLRELEMREDFFGDVSYSPVKDIVKKGLLPDPGLDVGDLENGLNILKGVEQYLFQNGLTAILYAIHSSFAKVFLGRKDNLIVLDRSFIDTLPYYRLRIGKSHPYESILLSRFLEMSDIAIHVPPYPGHEARYVRSGVSDVDEFNSIYTRLREENDKKVVELRSPSIEGRVEELLGILDTRR